MLTCILIRTLFCLQITKLLIVDDEKVMLQVMMEECRRVCAGWRGVQGGQ